MLKDKWLNRGFGPSVHIVQRGENQKSVPERKNITSIRLLPPLDKTDKTHKTPHPETLPMPEHLADALLTCGYSCPTWTPAGCRAFLSELQTEWPAFEVRGWYGCRFPECWPAALQDAVTSIYVLSLQDQGEVEA